MDPDVEPEVDLDDESDELDLSDEPPSELFADESDFAAALSFPLFAFSPLPAPFFEPFAARLSVR